MIQAWMVFTSNTFAEIKIEMKDNELLHELITKVIMHRIRYFEMNYYFYP